MSTSDVTSVLRGMLPSLPTKLHRVVTFYLDNPASAPKLTINEVAAATSVAPSTLTRLARMAGYDSFGAFRSALAANWAIRSYASREDEASSDISADDDLASVVKKIAYLDTESVASTARSIDLDVLARVTERLVSARRILIFGVGASHIVASDLHQKLLRISLPAHSPGEIHTALTMAALLRPGDLVIGFSHSGATPEVLDVAHIARERGCGVLAVTNDRSSELARLADDVLFTAAYETSFRAGATGSRLAQLTVVDCIFIAAAQQTLDESQRALELTFEAIQSRRRNSAAAKPATP